MRNTFIIPENGQKLILKMTGLALIVESSNLYDESAYKINPTTETALGIVVGVKIGFGF